MFAYRIVMVDVFWTICGGGLFVYALIELYSIKSINSVKPKSQEEWEQEQRERKKKYREEQKRK